MNRRIWLCADDYGISPGVNRAIRDLIENRRLNATSAMVVGPAIGREEANALKASVEANPRCAIGLHATLTAPFRPLTMHFRPIAQRGLAFAAAVSASTSSRPIAGPTTMVEVALRRPFSIRSRMARLTPGLMP